MEIRHRNHCECLMFTTRPAGSRRARGGPHEKEIITFPLGIKGSSLWVKSQSRESCEENSEGPVLAPAGEVHLVTARVLSGIFCPSPPEGLQTDFGRKYTSSSEIQPSYRRSPPQPLEVSNPGLALRTEINERHTPAISLETSVPACLLRNGPL